MDPGTPSVVDKKAQDCGESSICTPKKLVLTTTATLKARFHDQKESETEGNDMNKSGLDAMRVFIPAATRRWHSCAQEA